MTTTKFKTWVHGNNIQPIQVLDDNLEYIYLKDGHGYLKNGIDIQYHDTHEQAKQHLIGRTENLIKTLSEQLAAEKANLAKLQQLPKNTTQLLFDSGDYFKDLTEWENSFSCNGCGLEGTSKDFVYQRTVASGECWTCCNCGSETQVAEQPNEDNY